MVVPALFVLFDTSLRVLSLNKVRILIPSLLYPILVTLF